MPQFRSVLEDASEAGSDVRHGLIEESENIPSERFDFQSTPETRSVAEMAQRMLGIEPVLTRKNWQTG